MSADASPPPPLPAALYQGSVNTWECDANRHMNVRFHIERAMIGLSQMAHALELRRDAATLVLQDMHVRFLREAHVSQPLTMRGGVIECGADDAVVCLDMRHFDGSPGTVFRLKVGHAEAQELIPFAWSGRSRAAAAHLACALPTHAAPRAIDLKITPGAPSLMRAQELGAHRIGASIVTPDQCDHFGRLRGEHFFGRVSDAVPYLFATWRQQVEQVGLKGNIGGAMVEARLCVRAWPRAGDLIEVHSGVIETGPKLSRIVHWLLDPETGAAWASIEAAAVTFDLSTRKVVALPDELVALRRAQIVPGLAI